MLLIARSATLAAVSKRSVPETRVTEYEAFSVVSTAAETAPVPPMMTTCFTPRLFNATSVAVGSESFWVRRIGCVTVEAWPRGPLTNIDADTASAKPSPLTMIAVFLVL